MSTYSMETAGRATRRPAGLRQYLQSELVDASSGVCLEDVIRSCYREIFRQANKGRGVAPWRLQEQLHSIATDIVRRRCAALAAVGQ